jgi:hypothetical protein
MSGGLGVFGWQFTPQTQLWVTSLGILDTPNTGNPTFGDGLYESHRINLWDVTKPASPLVSVVLGSGSSGNLTGGFRMVDIPEIVLESGRNYVIGSSYTASAPTAMDLTTGPGVDPSLNVFVTPLINYSGYRFGSAGSANAIPFPTSFRPGEVVIFGPNFTYRFVPEPSIWALGLAGAVLLTAAHKSRRQQR